MPLHRIKKGDAKDAKEKQRGREGACVTYQTFDAQMSAPPGATGTPKGGQASLRRSHLLAPIQCGRKMLWRARCLLPRQRPFDGLAHGFGEEPPQNPHNLCLKDLDKGLLRDVNRTDRFHPFFTLFLFL